MTKNITTPDQEKARIAQANAEGRRPGPPPRFTGLLEGPAFREALIAKHGEEKAAKLLARLGR